MSVVDRPNIVLIMTDQQRGDCLGIEERGGLQTPNLDALAISGVRFSRAYSSCPSCVAARRSLMAGQKPSTHGIVGYSDFQEWRIEHTLPSTLQRAGYQTALVGRDMHLHPSRKRYGFETYITTKTHYPRWLAEHSSPWQGGESGHGIRGANWMARPWHLPEWQHEINWTTEQALRFLEDRDPSCPFFLVVSYYPPHPPLTPTAFYLEKYLSMELPDPVVGDWAIPPDERDALNPSSFNMQVPSEAARIFCAGYYALINQLDDQIGRILQPLKRREPDTFLLFTSDHGEMMGDHYWRHKGLPYEGSARIPFLLSGPDIPEGLVCDEVVGLEDVMPTLLQLGDVPIPETVDGESVLHLLSDSPGAWRPYLHGEHVHDAEWYKTGDFRHAPRITGMHYLTNGREKYIWFPGNGHEQLFDLVTDPQECYDLADRSEYEDSLRMWRERLVRELEGRPEGYSDGNQLVPGRPNSPTLPHVNGGKH